MKSVVYHGSPTGDIKEIKAHISTHGKKCIYATDNKVVAMLFMGSSMGDLDTVLAISEGLPILVERRSGVLKITIISLVIFMNLMEVVLDIISTYGRLRLFLLRRVLNQ